MGGDVPNVISVLSAIMILIISRSLVRMTDELEPCQDLF